MYSTERWEILRSQFKDTFFSMYGITSLPLLSLTVAAGLSTLKLAACEPPVSQTTGPSVIGTITADNANSTSTAQDPITESTLPFAYYGPNSIDPALPMMTDPTPLDPHSAHTHRNVDCPTCAKDLSVLAKEVPFSHHVNSTLVCRISGEVMDDVNYPMAFPNGYVYSFNVSQKIAQSIQVINSIGAHRLWKRWRTRTAGG
jgi:macrophage erythroblast attacher